MEESTSCWCSVGSAGNLWEISGAQDLAVTKWKPINAGRNSEKGEVARLCTAQNLSQKHSRVRYYNEEAVGILTKLHPKSSRVRGQPMTEAESGQLIIHALHHNPTKKQQPIAGGRASAWIKVISVYWHAGTAGHTIWGSWLCHCCLHQELEKAQDIGKSWKKLHSAGNPHKRNCIGWEVQKRWALQDLTLSSCSLLTKILML